jgi:predicted RNase H-like HicB family nuclease
LACHIRFRFTQTQASVNTVTIKDLPGCVSQGETKEEAFAMIEDARIGWLEVAYVHNDPIPEPQSLPS